MSPVLLLHPNSSMFILILSSSLRVVSYSFTSLDIINTKIFQLFLSPSIVYILTHIRIFRHHHHHHHHHLFLLLLLHLLLLLPHGLGRLPCSVIDALPLFSRASTISSSSRFVIEGVFRKSGVVHSFKMVDPVLFVFGSHVLYSRDLQFFPYNFASCFV